ncbi:hypothetical protein AKJ44_00815 [candidate division MSBL1 archaeon SCGC-AAA261F17]|uniref:Uncharacterized protein n=1 Tax=candidate division MSBL1 archaeon SCGC-AAA261F17 TaxID=1698274 RepID=A0A133V787_9EURY|nr:hypothetical protein AKJ44_00815 [candidate division MSBL1 archaeon SCGC-AAA261F17]
MIIIYRIRNLPQAKKVKFGREFRGYTDKSNRGQYEYYRKGLLDEIPHRKFIRGVLLIKREDREKMLDFMKEYKVEVHARNVELTPKDIEILSTRES